MKTKNPIKSTAVTVLAALIIVAMIVMCLLFSDYSFSEDQFSTLKILIIVCCCSVLYCFIVGEISQNFSQMDKLWSILPIVYSCIIAVRGGMKARLVIFAIIVTAWGIRLTVNFARKGAYSLKFWTGTEDYRWSIVRSASFFRSRIAWTAFDLFFISIYQNALVLAICLPALACTESSAPVGPLDIAASILAVLFLILETVSDEYQWSFHKTKKKLLAEYKNLSKLPKPYDLGFNTLGPWSRMRHPNYLGEQGIWISLYFMTCGAGITRSGIFHWSMIGPLLLILLFMGSSALGEAISAKKYPKYGEYVVQVFKYLPVHGYERGE